eukprot:Sspe_Gene.25880::Locus_10507_Transcript_1_1_Confidence_1.000_Length_1479::g.25880::m.25880
MQTLLKGLGAGAIVVVTMVLASGLFLDGHLHPTPPPAVGSHPTSSPIPTASPPPPQPPPEPTSVVPRTIPLDPSLPPDKWSPPGPPPPRPETCPSRFVTVNTHTWGRHHNQLQSTIHAILTAHLLNRTFIIGHFRHAKQWHEATELYGFSRLSKHFCIVDAQTAHRMLGTDRSITCFGQHIHDTPVGKRLGLRCRSLHHSVPKNFALSVFREVVRNALPSLVASSSRVINLSGQLAFYLRPGLRMLSQGYGLLEPAPEVAAEVARFQREGLGGAEYLAIHLRYREGTCVAEIHEEFTKSFNISDRLMGELIEQCTINFGYVRRVLHDSLGAAADGLSTRFPYPTFLASDHQNKSAEQDFLSRGAVFYSGRYHTKEIGGLKGLSTDYFLMRGGHAFVGNSASSVSQDTCFGRLMSLPWRRACVGWRLGFFKTWAVTALASLAPHDT